jgi:hypothetical protein
MMALSGWLTVILPHETPCHDWAPAYESSPHRIKERRGLLADSLGGIRLARNVGLPNTMRPPSLFK